MNGSIYQYEEKAMPNKEALLSSIRPDMQLEMDFFKKVYGYEISFPGFAEKVITELEAVGCFNARRYYTDWTKEYETKRNAELKDVAHWYRLRCEQEWEKRQKEGEEKRKRKEQTKSQKWTELSQILGFQ